MLRERISLKRVTNLLLEAEVLLVKDKTVAEIFRRIRVSVRSDYQIRAEESPP